MNTNTKFIMKLMLVMAVLASCSFGKNNYIDIPSKEETEESSAIYYALLETLDMWNEDTGLATIHRVGQNVVTMYGITDPNEQDLIVDFLIEYQRTHDIKPIEISFYQQQELDTRTLEDGSILTVRRSEDEILLREEWIE